MRLKPSEIRFSQDSINNVFDKRSRHAWREIGETLDDICEGRCGVESIPTITVIQERGRWITADNRRLWVFRELERLGKCETVSVDIGYYIPQKKRTSYNGGDSIRVRGPPGGNWYARPTVSRSLTSQHEGTNITTGQMLSEDKWAARDHTNQACRASEFTERRNEVYNRRPQTTVMTTERAFSSETFNPSYDHRSTDVASGNTGQPYRSSECIALSGRREEIHYSRPQTTVMATGRAPTFSIERLSLKSSSEYISKYSYGIRKMEVFIPGTHPEKYKVVSGGIEKCKHCFRRVIKKGQTLKPGQFLAKEKYERPPNVGPILRRNLHKSIHKRQVFVNKNGCSKHASFRMDLGALGLSSERSYEIEIVYVGGVDLKVIIRVGTREQEFHTQISVVEDV